MIGKLNPAVSSLGTLSGYIRFRAGRQLLTNENWPTINQTVMKPMAIKELKLSIGMDLSLQKTQGIPPWENNTHHPCQELIGTFGA